MRIRTIACAIFATAVLVWGTTAQLPAQTQSSQELYHVHFVKAAPGKVNELVSAFRAAPVPPGEPAPPLIFRHLQGDDWDLLVLSPLGKEETIRPVDTPDVQKSVQQMRPLRVQHSDTFTAGPAWSEVRAALMGSIAEPTGTSGDPDDDEMTATSVIPTDAATVPEGTVYGVTTYRSLPGHRDQLADTLRRIVALYPDRRTILQHVEGAPWEFVMIARYDSWTALGDETAVPSERLRAQGFANMDAIGTELRQHTAEHRDTIARMVR